MLAAIALVGPQGVSLGDGLPLVSSASLPGAGWAMLRMHSDGTPFSLYVGDGNIDWSGNVIALIAYDDQGKLVGGAAAAAGDIESGAYVQANPAGATPSLRLDEYQRHTHTGESSDIGERFNTGEPTDGSFTGNLTVVFWASGLEASWSYEVYGTTGTTILSGPTFGNSTYAFTSKDFQGTVNVGAEADPVGARAQYATSLPLHVNGTLLGFFDTSATGRTTYFATGGQFSTDSIHLRTPTQELTCPCHFVQATGPNALGPGDYLFEDTGISADRPELNDVIFVGADVPLSF